MRQKLRPWQFSVISLLLLIAGYLLLGAPALPDDFFGWRRKIGVLLIFFFFLRAVFTWGDVLRSTLPGTPSWFSFALGSAILANLILAMGVADLIGPGTSWIAVLILFFPEIGLATGKWKATSNSMSQKNAPDSIAPLIRKALLFSLGFAIFLYVIEGFALKGHGDVFTYHLSAPRMWFDQRRIARIDTFAVLHQSGLWDVLYLWAVELLGGAPGRGLVATQHFAQWMHGVLAYGGTAGALYFLFRACRFSPGLSLFGALAGLSTQALNASYAKNDWGAIFWIVSGVALYLHSRGKNRRVILVAGALIGCGVAAKWTALFFVFPWTVLTLIERRKERREWGLLIAGLIAGVLPLALRNWIQMGNPVFPTFNEFFKSPYLLPSYEAYLGHFQAPGFSLSYTKIARILHEVITDTFPTRLLALAIPLTAWLALGRNRKLPSGFGILVAATVAGLILFLGKTGPETQTRLAGPLLVMAASTSLVAVLAAFDSFAPRVFRSVALQAAIALILILGSNFPLYALAKLPKYKPSNETILAFSAGRYKAWIRSHIRPGTQILHADPEFYYLTGYSLIAFPDVVESKTPEPQYQDARWLIHAFASRQPGYLALNLADPKTAALLTYIAQYRPESVLYRDNTYVVIDFWRLKPLSI